jgi:hypothetical protein
VPRQRNNVATAGLIHAASRNIEKINALPVNEP